MTEAVSDSREIPLQLMARDLVIEVRQSPQRALARRV